MINKKNIFQKIHESSKFGEYASYTVLFSFIGMSYGIGYILWIISRPIVAVAHLFMLNPWTALDEIKDFTPRQSIKDL